MMGPIRTPGPARINERVVDGLLNVIDDALFEIDWVVAEQANAGGSLFGDRKAGAARRERCHVRRAVTTYVQLHTRANSAARGEVLEVLGQATQCLPTTATTKTAVQYRTPRTEAAIQIAAQQPDRCAIRVAPAESLRSERRQPEQPPPR